VKGCTTYQESKVITHIKHTPLYHLNTFVEQGPFQYVSMDLITDLPTSNTFDSILTIVDQGCSKAANFIPCNKTIDGQGMQSYTYNTYSLGSEFLKESYQIKIQDSQATLVKLFAKRPTFNRILVQPFTLAQMDKLNA